MENSGLTIAFRIAKKISPPFSVAFLCILCVKGFA